MRHRRINEQVEEDYNVYDPRLNFDDSARAIRDKFDKAIRMKGIDYPEFVQEYRVFEGLI